MLSDFDKKIIEWWRNSGRRFPWRETRDAYGVFIAEILLHRTRAENVARVYPKFRERFPDLASVAGADLEDILSTCRPLGLTWRFGLLKQAATEIENRYNGRIPLDRKELASLPGIGDYISSAISVFAGGSREELIDTNTIRVICRISGIIVNDGIRRQRWVREMYSRLMDHADPVAFAYSMIDLGSLICRPRDPLCGDCPVNELCNTYSRTA